MSEALERVIAEQQKRIDNLEGLLAIREKALEWQHERMDKFISSVFNHLDYPYNENHRVDVKQGLIDFGYCLQCECSPCECDD